MRLKRFVFVLFALSVVYQTKAQNPNIPNENYGKWMSSENNLEIELSKVNGVIMSKIIWFKLDNGQKPLSEWTDAKNPHPELRSRKLLGLNVLTHMVYDPKSKSWEHGTIYDAVSGKYWDASARITDNGNLEVKAYWKFKFIGKTLSFRKVD